VSSETRSISAGEQLAEQDSFLQGVKDCVPTLLGYLSIGLAAGVVQKTAGLTIAEIALLSLLLYAGSAQFIFAGMISVGSAPAAIIFTIFFVNLRHLLLSASLSPYLRHLSVWRNMWVGSLLTDETFGVAIQQAVTRKKLGERWMHGLNVTAYLNWLIANLAGAMLADWISNPEQYGLGFALPAMFIGLLVLSLLGRGKLKLDIAIAIIAAAVAIGSALLFSGSMGIIIATIVASTIGMAVEKRWK